MYSQAALMFNKYLTCVDKVKSMMSEISKSFDNANLIEIFVHKICFHCSSVGKHFQYNRKWIAGLGVKSFQRDFANENLPGSDPNPNLNFQNSSKHPFGCRKQISGTFSIKLKISLLINKSHSTEPSPQQPSKRFPPHSMQSLPFAINRWVASTIFKLKCCVTWIFTLEQTLLI